jgi:hypothetical protein
MGVFKFKIKLKFQIKGTKGTKLKELQILQQ